MATNTDSSLAPLHVTNSSYCYQSLDPGENGIRLLKIHQARQAAKYSEPVECILLTTSLEISPTYQALSYTWGTAPNVEEILLDGRRFKITPNLEAALLQLQANGVELVWIDAICINQTVLAERSKQVSKMRTIYERADHVLVWLGSSGIENAPLAFDILEKLYQHRHSEDSINSIIYDQSSTRSLQALRDLLERDYWARRWIVQEINSAKKLTLLCGTFKIDWQKVLAVQKMIQSKLSLFSPLYRPTAQVPALLDWDVIIYLSGPEHLELSRKGATTPTLYSLLCKYWIQRASDPRDIIYALAGISTAGNDNDFVIDYSASTERVYIDTTIYILKSSQRLDCICSMPRRISALSLPSWIPD